MNLGQILSEVARKTGADLDNAAERTILLDDVNKAAREIYRSRDLPMTLQEVYIRATADRELALPPFVDKIRAIRPGCTDYCTTKWELHTMYPRYNKAEWSNQWKNWRVKGTAPVGIEWLNTAPGTITYPVVDADLEITFVGETENSNRAIDTVSMTATSMTWTKTFLSLKKIMKNKITDYNVVISDADGNECAIIYADQLESHYQLVDVSEYPSAGWGCCACADGTAIMEVLYKPLLPLMYNDADTFPIIGYDDALIAKTLQLIAEDRPGEEQRALLMDARVSRMLAEEAGDRNGHIDRRITFGPGKYFKRGYYERFRTK